MAEKEAQKRHIREVLLHKFREGKSASLSAQEICQCYGESAVHRNTALKWFKRFREGDFSLDDHPRSGRPTVLDSDTLRAVVDKNPRMTVAEIAEELDMPNSTIFYHLKRLNRVNRCDV